MGLIGSRYYCNNPRFPIGRPDIQSHVAMVNMDMIGYLNQGYYFAGFNEGESSIDLSRIIEKLNSKYSFAKRITSRGSGGSDHASFYNKRIPVAFLHTGLHDYYHTPQDTPDKINYEGMEQIARYACELVWEIANAEARPQFNHTSFKPMEYVHDHGHPNVPFYHHYHQHPHQN
jgi:Zn-dependent M28 family amino/carboxypeptidase